MAEINFNAVLGRQFILNPRFRLYIETSGICNLACRFCAYPKKESAKVVMPMEMFQNIVNQAVDVGFSHISLTPLTGEVFMDKGFLDKTQYLDNHPKIVEYYFSTNFVIPSKQQLEALFKLNKLGIMHVSLYGHDEESFCALTQHSKKQYYRLVRNIKYLSELYNEKSAFKLVISWRTTPNFSINQVPNNELQQTVWDIRRKHHIEIDNTPLYDNWGGLITKEDVEDIGIKIKDSSCVYKKGICTLIFDRIAVLADGRVNACACRDVNGSLNIGNIKNNSLANILSIDNSVYQDIIQEQIDGKFRPACKECSFYRSIYTPIPNPFTKYYNLQQVRKIIK